MADRGQGSGSSGSSHPFLTQRGLWLQQNGRVDQPSGLPLPYSAPGQWQLREQVPTHPSDSANSEVVQSSYVPPSSQPNTSPMLSGFQEAASAEMMSQNIHAAAEFPNPQVLRRRPLTNLYRSALDTDDSWKRVDRSARRLPFRAIGKMVIRLPGDREGQFASGSAFILGGNTIVTCAHNLFDSNKRQWSASLEFYPGYDFYSTKPTVACRVTSGTIPRGYLENPLTNHDLAVCRVDRNISELVGAEIPLEPIDGIKFFDQHFVDIAGYPAGSGFDFGKQLWRSRGKFLFGMSAGAEDQHAPTLASNFGGGASGCPWLWHDKQNDRWVAVGVTSGHARLRYTSGEPNLLSLTSSLLTNRTIEKLQQDGVEHKFSA